jgi:hypothetical protein
MVLAFSLLGALPGLAQDASQSAPPPASSGGWRKFPTDPSGTAAPQAPVIRNKQFRKLMHSVVPNCIFHYGLDMPLSDALEMVL